MMTQDDFLKLVTHVRSEHPRWFDLNPDSSPSDHDLTRIEDDLGCRLPLDYRWFLREFGGGDFAFAWIYSADRTSKLYIGVNQDHPEHDYVAVSDDGTGNLFGFPVRDGQCEDKIVIFDHDSLRLRPSKFEGFLDFVASTAFQP